VDRIIEPLVLDLVASVAAGPRSYAQVIEVWRTSCPRLSVWEDAVDAGLVACRTEDGVLVVAATGAGRAALAAAGRA
jgi:hypothetical protein